MHQIQIKELVNGIEITENLDGVVVVKLLSYNSRPFFRTTNETDEESYQVLDTLGEIYHLPALATEFVLIDLQGNYWIPDNGTELIEYSYKIRCFRPDNENDKVLSIGEIETTSNSVTLNVPGVGLANTVRIDGTIYTNYYPSVFNYTPIVEFIKILIIYAKPDSTVFYLAQGDESSEAVEPPYDGLFVAKITVNLSGQIIDTGNGLTLEQARQNGNEFLGDVNIPIIDNTEFIGFLGNNIPNGTEFKLGYFIDYRSDNLLFGNYVDEYNFWGIQENRRNSIFLIKGIKDGIEYQFTVADFIEFATSDINSKGLIGGAEFNKQGDRKAFAQLSDVYDFGIPLTGTEEGKPVTGDIEFVQNDYDVKGFKIINNSTGTYSTIGFFNHPASDENSFGTITDNIISAINFRSTNNDPKLSLRYSHPDNGDTTFDISSDNIRIESSLLEDFKGIVGNEEFDKQGDRKAFAQLSDVYDPEAFIQLLNDSNSTQLATIKGLLGIV